MNINNQIKKKSYLLQLADLLKDKNTITHPVKPHALGLRLIQYTI